MDFKEKFKTYSTKELLRITENSENYQSLAIEAANSILLSRKLTEEEIQITKQALELEKQEQEKKEKKKVNVDNEIKDSDIYILKKPVDETIPEVQTKEELQKWRLLLIIGFVTVMVGSLIYSFKHYSDGGCDGGLCALGIVFHGFPLLLSWIFTLLAINFYTKIKALSIIFLVIATVINIGLLTLTYGYREGALKHPLYLLLLIHSMLFFMSLNLKKKNLKIK